MPRIFKFNLLMAAILLAACSSNSTDYKNTMITKENQLEVIKTVNTAKKVTKADAESFLKGTSQLNALSGSIIGYTVNEVILTGEGKTVVKVPPANK
jgi:hypothetical protein